jgi:predicted DsbA family dithiol-disulfide isomerase
VRVEQLEREYDVVADWQPYELHPEVPPEGMPREALLPRPYLERAEESMRVLAAEVGLNMHRPARLINSRLALQAAEFARDHGAFESVHLALFRAHWQEERDLGSVATLREIVAGAGLDPTAMAAALAEGRYLQRLAAAREQALSAGIHAIPAHVAGGYLVLGAQPYASFERLMDRLGVPKRPVAEH